jgi:hypothetical protein
MERRKKEREHKEIKQGAGQHFHMEMLPFPMGVCQSAITRHMGTLPFPMGVCQPAITRLSCQFCLFPGIQNRQTSPCFPPVFFVTYAQTFQELQISA